MKSSLTPQSLIHHVISKTASQKLGGDEGIHFGPAEREIRGMTVAWMATPEAIQAAGESGHQLLVVHESLFQPYDVIHSAHPPDNWESWPVNAVKRELLEHYKLTVVRLHLSVDELFILDRFSELLELGPPVHEDGLVKVYERDFMTARELVGHVKQRLKMASVRVAGLSTTAALDRPVRRIGCPWGGLGLFVNVAYQQELVAQKCDILIGGECDNYGFRFAVESGVPIIETSHDISEDPGVEDFAEWLKTEYPEVEVKFVPSPCIWEAH